MVGTAFRSGGSGKRCNSRRDWDGWLGAQAARLGPNTGRLTLALMRAIAQDGDSISAQGQRAAEQAAMSLDSLFLAYKQNAKAENESELRESINGLFQQLDNPSAYNAPRFAAQMQKVSSVLARIGREKASQ